MVAMGVDREKERERERAQLGKADVSRQLEPECYFKNGLREAGQHGMGVTLTRKVTHLECAQAMYFVFLLLLLLFLLLLL